jgi:hypothetical protein
MATQTRLSVETQIIARALKDESFKQQLLSNANVAKAEIEKALGQAMSKAFQVQVLAETADTAYIVLPYVASTEGMTDKQLESVASGGIHVSGDLSVPCMFGSITFQ